MIKPLFLVLLASFILFGGCKESKISNEVVASKDLDTLFDDYQVFKLVQLQNLLQQVYIWS